MTGSGAADRILLDHVGLKWVAIAALLIIPLLDVAAVWYLFSPRPIGFIVCVSSIVLQGAETVVALVVGRLHPDALRHAMIVSRQARGLPARREAIEMMMNPTAFGLMLGGSVVISAFLTYLVWRHRNHFAVA